MTAIDLAETPSKILAFDTEKKRAPEPVDLDSPFFTIQRAPSYPDCDHRNRGVTLDMGRRKAICLCGVEIDTFDALLIYAHAQRRLTETRRFIEEARRKEEEKKMRRPFSKRVEGFETVHDRRGGVTGYHVSLECGHKHRLFTRRRRPPRKVTCETCVREAKLKAVSVAVVPPAAAEHQL